MPQRSKGPRLYFHAARGKYVIRDTGRPEIATGTGIREEAEKHLALYIASRDRPVGTSLPDHFLITDALRLYATEHGKTVKDSGRIWSAIDALNPFWSGLPVSAVKGETCRRYSSSRVTGKGMEQGQTRPVSDGTIRRELGVLRAALQHCVAEGYLLSAPPVTLPEKPAPKERWLTRSEAAGLILAARKSVRGKHLARFILVGLYTGTRKSAILGLRFMPHVSGGWVDTERGLLYRRAEGMKETKKRQPPASLPRRLLAHLRRWERMGARWVVEYQGGRCGDIKTGWTAIAEDVGMPDVTPHTLRHTAITWAMRNGARTWDAASYFGASVQIIESVYGHHHPDAQATARNAMDQRHLVRQTVRKKPTNGPKSD